MKCKCRTCDKVYEESKSRADWKGYCSQKCLRARAKMRGYRPSTERRLGRTHSVYAILNRVGDIGSIPI